MKTLILNILMPVTIVVGIIVFIASCKKEDKPKGCSSTVGGLTTIPLADVMFYTMTDPKCGFFNLTKIKNLTTGETNYTINGAIDKYFIAQPPACGANIQGTITARLPKGYTYEYTMSCTSRTVTGTVTIDCADNCKSVEIK